MQAEERLGEQPPAPWPRPRALRAATPGVERIVALGARRVDIRHSGTQAWTVLADPERNEFCILRPKKTLIAW